MPMSSDPVVVTPDLLREWGLPDGGDSKLSRGQVLVVGGDLRSPGAAVLAGTAALRVGAGRITLAVARSVAVQVGVVVPECGIIALGENAAGSVAGDAAASAVAEALPATDALLIGPGLADIDETEALLRALGPRLDRQPVTVLDAFALGALSRAPDLRDRFGGDLVLTPNKEEAARLLGRDVDDLATDAREIAERFRSVVAVHGHVAEPGGGSWLIGTGSSGLGTSGSGDVLSGAVAGFCGRGVPPARAAVWASYAHAVAGDRLAVRVGPLGYLAGEILGELPRVLVEVGGS